MKEAYIMMGMAVMLIIAYLSFVIVRRKEIPPSVSQTVFDLPKRWIWSAFLGLEAWLIAPGFIEKTSDNFQFLAFFTVVALGVLGVYPLFKGEKNTIHNVAGVAACVFSQAVIAIERPSLLLSWLFFGLLMGLKEGREKWCFFAEVICFVSVYMYCFI